MEEEKATQQPEQKEITEADLMDANSTNSVRLGDIGLSSTYLTMRELLSFVKSMLEDKTLREYLDLIKVKKTSGASMFG